jgi:hypothetical protein
MLLLFQNASDKTPTVTFGAPIAWGIGAHNETGFAAKIKINLVMALPAHLDCGWFYASRL